MNNLLDFDTTKKIEDLYQIPLMGNSDKEKELMFLAILIQNAFQKKNSDRTAAIKYKYYV